LGRWALIREPSGGGSPGTMARKLWIWGSFCKDREDDEARDGMEEERYPGLGGRGAGNGEKFLVVTHLTVKANDRCVCA
jgi:hypothetical protein